MREGKTVRWLLCVTGGVGVAVRCCARGEADEWGRASVRERRARWLGRLGGLAEWVLAQLGLPLFFV